MAVGPRRSTAAIARSARVAVAGAFALREQRLREPDRRVEPPRELLGLDPATPPPPARPSNVANRPAAIAIGWYTCAPSAATRCT